MEKYDQIGQNYNHTRKADPFLTSKLTDLLSPIPGKTYLDIGCGTGNYTLELEKTGAHFIGIDPSIEMLSKAKLKSKTIDWRVGFADNTGLVSESVDGILGTLTIHHWPDLYVAFKELHRILKPHGNIVLFTSTPEQMRGYWLNHYFPNMLESSMNQMPSFEKVKDVMEKSGFTIPQTEAYFVKPDLKDLFLYCGKHNPSLYLDPQVRAGISSFSSLANLDEVKQGLSKLQKDLMSEEINDVMKEYENNVGDYLFIKGSKS
ncbi:MAG TPA: class I SAM-dependent methyltransferase [Fulvivirga sp.]|nr:class I SAM-dependent methyltransferase [Fulvivirga sp.]